MTYRQNDSSSKDTHSRPQSRLNQQIHSEPKDEGCPVIEESGTVCGETYSLGIFKEFRQIYDDCLKNLAGSKSGSATLKKLAPFRRLIDNLWEQNKMLVETVEELEQEAANRVSNLQDRLNKCCQKMCDYRDDVKSLVSIVQCFSDNGAFDMSGLKLKTFCPPQSGHSEKSSVKPNVKREEKDSKYSMKNKTFPYDNSFYDAYTEEDIKVKSPYEESVLHASKLSSKGHITPPQKKTGVRKTPAPVRAVPTAFCDRLEMYNKFDPYNKIGNGMIEDRIGYQDSNRPININFNITNDGVLGSTDCCCGCSCYLNGPEINDLCNC